MNELHRNVRYERDGNVVRIIYEDDSPVSEVLSVDKPRKQTKSNKLPGKKSEVYALDVADMKKIVSYFADNGKWIYYLAFILSCNLARRASDILDLTWDKFFDPATGGFRRDMGDIIEQKTDKLANPHINSAVRSAITKYCEMTNCDPSADNYGNKVFVQLSGNYAGRMLSYSAYIKAIKKAGEEVGIAYNIGTHSPRKTFGMISRMLHPNDPDSMELLMTFFNHSDTKITSRYIGLTKQKIDKYVDDMGGFFDDYIVGDKEYVQVASTPVVSLDVNDLRELISVAYSAGRDNAAEDDPMKHIGAINEIMSLVDAMTIR